MKPAEIAMRTMRKVFRGLRLAGIAASLLAGLAGAPRAEAQDGGRAPSFSETQMKARSPYAARLAEAAEKSQAMPDGTPWPGPDGWADYLALIDAFRAAIDAATPANDKGERPTIEFEALYFDGHMLAANAPSAEKLERAARALDAAAKAGVFDKARAIVPVRKAVRPVQDGPMMTWQLPDLSAARMLARAQAGRMRTARLAGDWPSFEKAFEESLAVSRILTHQGVLIDQLVGTAVASLAMRQLRVVLPEHPIPADVMKRLAGTLETQSIVPALGAAFEGERCLSLDSIGLMFADGKPDLDMIRGFVSMDEARFAEESAAGIATREQMEESANALFDGVIRAAATPRPGRKAAFDLAAFIEAMPKDRFPVKVVAPAFDRAMTAADQLAAELAGTRAVLALERYRDDKKALPASLNDLVPAYLAAVPVDPCSGAPLGYRVLGADDMSLSMAVRGRGYIVYSVGADGEDNGGKAPPANQPPGAAAGYDYVINVQQQ